MKVDPTLRAIYYLCLYNSDMSHWGKDTEATNELIKLKRIQRRLKDRKKSLSLIDLAVEILKSKAI